MINLSKLAALAKATPTELAQSTSADALAQEKLTRRAALRRLGMTGAMTVLGVLSVDELARVASKKLGEHEMTRNLANDFKDAGIAMADDVGNDMIKYQPPSDQEIGNAIKDCIKETDRNAFLLCFGKHFGKATWDDNWQYIYCKMQDPNGNNGACPGFPNAYPCDDPDPVQKVALSCCEAKALKCFADSMGAGTAAAAKCENQLTICDIKADGLA